jgi:orotidine-5'-phosphate decarboxylase
VIIDCKVGDIANTMNRYARAFFNEMKADAITVNPLMGEDVITPLRAYKDKLSFILAVTSNPTASDFLKKNALYRTIVEKIAEWGSEQFGAVVGATNPGELSELRKMLPETLFLVPGIGAQGGDIEVVMKEGTAKRSDPRMLINSSRGIIFREKGENFAEAAAEATEELRISINQYL